MLYGNTKQSTEKQRLFLEKLALINNKKIIKKKKKNL